MIKRFCCCLLLGWIVPASYAMPPRPEPDPKAPTISRVVEGSHRVARLTLLHGRVEAWNAQGQRLEVEPGAGLLNGDVVHLAPVARAHLVLATQDRLDIAGEAWLRLSQRARGGHLELWRGKVVLQVLPDLQQKRAPIFIETPLGTLQASVGHLGVAVGRDERTDVVVFDNQVRWNGQTIVEGGGLEIGGGLPKRKTLTPRQALQWRARVVALVPLLREALAKYSGGEVRKAAERFQALQAAYPENAPAAYFLGQIAVERGDLLTAVRQWRRYARLAPEGARHRQVNRYLTALTNKLLDHEIKALTQGEENLRQSRVAPHTLAVMPFSLQRPLAGMNPRRQRRVGKALTALMMSDLKKAAPGLRLLERVKVERLLEELRLNVAGLTDPARSAGVGRLLRAERMLVGSYRLEGGEP